MLHKINFGARIHGGVKIPLPANSNDFFACRVGYLSLVSSKAWPEQGRDMPVLHRCSHIIDDIPCGNCVRIYHFHNFSLKLQLHTPSVAFRVSAIMITPKLIMLEMTSYLYTQKMKGKI